MYRYFVSYNSRRRSDGAMGFGNADWHTEPPIATRQQLNELTDRHGDAIGSDLVVLWWQQYSDATEF